MTRHPALVLLAALTALALAGCGGGGGNAGGATTTSASPSCAPPPDPAVAWANTVCASLNPLVTAASPPPAPNPSDAVATKQAYSNYLGNLIAAIDRGLAGLDAAGPAPVANGQAVTADLRNVLTGVRSNLAQAQNQLAAADPNDPTAVARALSSLASLPQITGPLAELRNNPQLQLAFQQAPNCQRLSGTTSAPPPSQPLTPTHFPVPPPGSSR